jgi:hypothetical protein
VEISNMQLKVNGHYYDMGYYLSDIYPAWSNLSRKSKTLKVGGESNS